jgi:hypothetical protein
MQHAYQPELWRDIFLMLGTSSASLIGLLFIVYSLHLDEIRNQPVFRIRAHNRTLYLLVMLVEAVLVLLPQPMVVCGAELVAVNLFGLWFPLKHAYCFIRTNNEISHGDSGWAIYRAIRYIVAFLLGVAGGAALIGQTTWGIYLVTASSVSLLVLVVLNAHSIMVGADSGPRKDHARVAPEGSGAGDLGYRTNAGRPGATAAGADGRAQDRGSRLA